MIGPAMNRHQSRGNKSVSTPVILALSAFAISQCVPRAISPTAAVPSASPSPEQVHLSGPPTTVVPAPRVRSTATSAASPSPVRSAATLNLTPSSTPTLLPGRAPSLPHLDVHFITHGDRELPYVALTFDMCQAPDNPAGFDEGIVAALLEYEAPATFFMGGDWMRTHITETRLLDGIPLFELGNHSWSHPDMRELTEAEMSAEVLRTQDMMYQITGHQTVLFRYPSGWYSDLALSVVAWHGLYSIQWDIVTADPVPDNTAENILGRVREQVQNGSIIIMHANGRGWHTAEALPQMIEYLRGEGYCLVTVSQMIGLEPASTDCGFED